MTQLLVSIGLSVFFFVAGVICGLGFEEFMRRPRVRVTGRGSAKMGPYDVFTLSVTNEANFLGASIGPTVFFGKTIVGDHRPGVTVARHPAKLTAGAREDGALARSGQSIGLAFLDPAGQGEPVGTVTIEDGESASLLLVAKEEGQVSRYAYFIPGGPDGQPRMPPLDAQFTGDKRFVVTIHCANSNRGLDIPVTVTRNVSDPGGGFWVETPNGGSSW